MTNVLSRPNRQWWLIIGCPLFGLALSWWYTAHAVPHYQSSAQVLFSAAPVDEKNAVAALTSVMTFSQARLATYAQLASSTAVVDSAQRAAGTREDSAGLQSRILASADANTGILIVTVNDPDPQHAASLANGITDALITQVAALEAPLHGGVSPVSGSILRRASATGVPVWPRLGFNLALGLVAGGATGLGLAVIRDQLDTRVRGVAGLREALDVTPLTSIPRYKFRAIGRRRRRVKEDRLESIRRLRTTLAFASAADRPLRVLVVTSTHRGSGATTVARDLALAFAASGSRVLLIDGDLRHRDLSADFRLDEEIGLSHVLAGLADVGDAIRRVDRLSVWALAAGVVAPNPTELLGSEQLSAVLRWCRAHYDTTVVDAGRLVGVSDGALTAARADGTVLVVREGLTRAGELREAVRSLESVGARLLGVVLNADRGRRTRDRWIPAALPPASTVPAAKERPIRPGSAVWH